MDYLSNQFNILSLTEAIQRMKQKELPDNAIVITFDDGYRDNFLNAFPILTTYSIPATIFLISDVVCSGVPPWYEQVFYSLRKTNAPCLHCYGPSKSTYSLKTVPDKALANREILKFLRLLSIEEREFWLDQLTSQLNIPKPIGEQDLMLSWEDIKTMHENNIHFGSHTATHPILSRLSIEEIKDEVYRSKRVIEDHLGTRINTFAYPSGRAMDFNQEAKYVVREAGYDCALTMIFGANNPDEDLFELRRLTAWDDDIHTFGTRLNYYKFCT